jgi:hypothetical protein
MASASIPNSPEHQLRDLKLAFEAAVEELQGDRADRAKQPIYPRKQAEVASSQGSDHNRSLNAAAEALAALWKTQIKSASRQSKTSDSSVPGSKKADSPRTPTSLRSPERPGMTKVARCRRRG